MTQVSIPAVAARLSASLRSKYPDAAARIETDPFGALDDVPDVTIERRTGRVRGACPVDGSYNAGPPTIITIYETGTPERDNFTCLHELGHHLLANDEGWQYEDKPALGDRARYIEETIVNAFAAHELIPDNLLHTHVGPHVTAASVLELYLASNASASASLMRSLDIPGNRLVMLTDLAGTTWFSDSTGEPFSPGTNVPQPGVAAAIDHARNGNGTHRAVGGHGIAYRSGKTNPWVEIDVAVHDGMAFVVAHPTPRDSRAPGASDWTLTCANCGHEFAPAESSGFCTGCREHKCPQCRACECTDTQPPICTRCFVALSVSEANDGLEEHRDC